MRLVFWVFLLLNVAYFYWQSSIVPPPPPALVPQEPALPPGVQSLALLRERGLTADQEPPPLQVESRPPAAQSSSVTTVQALPDPEPDEPEPPAPKVMACFTLGPFAEEEGATKLVEGLRANGAEVELRQSKRRIPRGYWVYLPPYESYAAARKKSEELRKRGINDLYIMGKGEMKNAISLGLFKRKSAAVETFNQVRAKEPATVMETQYRVTPQYWLDIAVDSQETAGIAEITVLAEEHPGVALAQRKRCK